jgi:hypothetical protein
MEKRIGRALCLALSALFAGPALAHLGGNADDVARDAQSLRAALHSSTASGYVVHELNGPGQTIREYANANGIVFAVAWSGAVAPDLSQLLGSYFGAYSSAIQSLSQPGLQRSLNLQLPGLTVETGGHLRAYRGRAFVPDQLPSGMSPADIQ